MKEFKNKASPGEMWITRGNNIIIIRGSDNYCWCDVYKNTADAINKSEITNSCSYTQDWLHKRITKEKNPEYFL